MICIISTNGVRGHAWQGWLDLESRPVESRCPRRSANPYASIAGGAKRRDERGRQTLLQSEPLERRTVVTIRTVLRSDPQVAVAVLRQTHGRETAKPRFGSIGSKRIRPWWQDVGSYTSRQKKYQ